MEMEMELELELELEWQKEGCFGEGMFPVLNFGTTPVAPRNEPNPRSGLCTWR